MLAPSFLSLTLLLSWTSACAAEYSQLISNSTSGLKLGPKPGPAQDSGEVSSSSGEADGLYREVTVGYPPGSSYQLSREVADDFKTSRSSGKRKQRSRKVFPGQYADKRKNPNWKQWPEYLQSSVLPSDSKIAWGYWEEDEHEGWEPDDADDSKHTTTTSTTTTTTAAPTTTTTTTTTTPAPTTITTSTTKAKPPVSIHKHFHYFKKTTDNGPWKGETATMPPVIATPMPMEEMMMKMPEEMMMEMMMKGMMTMPPPAHPSADKSKGGLSSIFDKLSKVDPITVLVAGIVPASLILAAALPSVMHKVMKNTNNGDDGSSMIPIITTTAVDDGMMSGRMRSDDGSMIPMIMTTFFDNGMMSARRSDDGTMIPMITTTAVDDGTMSGRRTSDDGTMDTFVDAVGKFGRRALEQPRCARAMLCRFARERIVSDSAVVRRAVQFAEVAMENSWLDDLGVRSIFKSINDDNCNEVECDIEPEKFNELF